MMVNGKINEKTGEGDEEVEEKYILKNCMTLEIHSKMAVDSTLEHSYENNKTK